MERLSAAPLHEKYIFSNGFLALRARFQGKV